MIRLSRRGRRDKGPPHLKTSRIVQVHSSAKSWRPEWEGRALFRPAHPA